MWVADIVHPLPLLPYLRTRKKVLIMSWNFLISFGVGFGVYLVVLLIWSLIKKHKIKKEIRKDDELNGDKKDSE